MCAFCVVGSDPAGFKGAADRAGMDIVSSKRGKLETLQLCLYTQTFVIFTSVMRLLLVVF